MEDRPVMDRHDGGAPLDFSFSYFSVTRVDSLLRGICARSLLVAYAAYVLCLFSAFFLSMSVVGVGIGILVGRMDVLLWQVWFWVALALALIGSLFGDVGIASLLVQIRFRSFLKERHWPPMLLRWKHMAAGHLAWKRLPMYEDWVLTPDGNSGDTAESLEQALVLIGSLYGIRPTLAARLIRLRL